MGEGVDKALVGLEEERRRFAEVLPEELAARSAVAAAGSASVGILDRAPTATIEAAVSWRTLERPLAALLDALAYDLDAKLLAQARPAGGDRALSAGLPMLEGIVDVFGADVTVFTSVDVANVLVAHGLDTVAPRHGRYRAGQHEGREDGEFEVDVYATDALAGDGEASTVVAMRSEGLAVTVSSAVVLEAEVGVKATSLAARAEVALSSPAESVAFRATEPRAASSEVVFEVSSSILGAKVVARHVGSGIESEAEASSETLARRRALERLEERLRAPIGAGT